MAIIKEVSTSSAIKVQIVSRDPDLLVYVTKYKSDARGKDEIWFFDSSSDAVKIKFVNNSPDLKIQYVNSKSNAGWKNKSHRLQKRLG